MVSKVGVLGGTFDPVHVGHLRIAEEAVELLGLDYCIFLPAWIPPHKPEMKIVPFEHRWRMLELATGDNPRFILSDLEKRLAGKSYTVISLKHLRKEFSYSTEIYFLMGVDAFLEIHTWRQYQKLFELASITIVRRPGFTYQAISEQVRTRISPEYRWNPHQFCFDHPKLYPIVLLPTTNLDISATELRQLIKEGRSIRYLVPDNVLKYINYYGLYTTVVRTEVGQK